MKQSQHTTSSELKTTANDVVRWALELRHLHARMASFFARPEPRHRCLLYLVNALPSERILPSDVSICLPI
jgi:hypothetical protein